MQITPEDVPGNLAHEALAGDGPETADGSYEYSGHSYRLDEAGSDTWAVYDDETYLGILTLVEPEDDEPEPRYVGRLAGEESIDGGEPTDDWRAALEDLIEAAE